MGAVRAAGLSTLPLLLLLLPERLLAICPACTGASTPTQGGSVWPVVGVFLLLPFFLFGAVVMALRREFRTTFEGPRKRSGQGPAKVLAFPYGRAG